MPAVAAHGFHTKTDHLMRLMARSSFPAYLMFIIYNSLPQQRLFLFYFFFLSLFKIFRRKEKNFRWTVSIVLIYNNPRALPRFSDLQLIVTRTHSREALESLLYFPECIWGSWYLGVWGKAGQGKPILVIFSRFPSTKKRKEFVSLYNSDGECVVLS